MKIALAGNPNSGKTTLFNALTGLNQKIGNWAGVTVEKKSGRYRADKSIEIIDLPGVYSLNPISADEKITRDFLLTEKADAVINVLDSADLERGLMLTLQLVETGIPVVLALNMQDELKLHGLTLDIAAFERELKIKAAAVSARKNRNINALMELAVAAAKDGTAAPFTAQGDSEEEKTAFRHAYIASVIDVLRVKSESKIKRITQKIDKIVLNKWLAFPIFAAVIFTMFYVSIQSVGGWLSESVEWLFFDAIGENLRTGLTGAGAAQWVSSLMVDGIVAGVGTVLAFVPQIIILFLFITFLEGCGYMARIAVLMDRIFKKLGLSGKSFIPMLIGCGCTVPAIMSAKTIDGEAERKKTILLTPFMPCSAKLPVFALIAGALFPNNPFVAPSMYFLAIAMVIVWGLLLNAFRRKKASSDAVVMQLPHYRLPQAKFVALELWSKVKGFLIRAGVIIVPAAIILWFLQSFSFGFVFVETQDSILAAIGRGIAWIFRPLGFGDWQAAVAVITGVFAKETVAATFGIMGTDLTQIFTPHAAYAFMAFLLLSAPCAAAVAATRKETNSTKFMFIAFAFQCAAGYLLALIINQAGNLWAYNPTLCISILTGILIAGIFALSIRHAVKKRKRGGGCAAGCGGCVRQTSCAEKENINEAKSEAVKEPLSN
ncbi:MAG: ferrous iron transporter B [Firmicutes bacterium]|nr:ferrous iron transporter B [Bacillota bacterium]